MKARTRGPGWLAISAPLVLPLLLATGGARAQEGDGVVAFVWSVAGRAELVRGDGSRRALACHDLVRAGERVVTADGGRVGAVAGDVLVHVDQASDVAFARAADGGAQLDLARGAVRTVDAPDTAGAPPVRVRTPNAAARGRRGEVEAFVLDEKAGLYSMLCAWREPLEVARRSGAARRDGAEQIAAAAGECAFVKPGQKLYTAPAREHRVALAGESCRPRDVIGAAGDRFALTDVAAPPPPPFRVLDPIDPDIRTNGPCDDPGKICDFLPEPEGPVIIPVEPPVVPEEPPGVP